MQLTDSEKRVKINSITRHIAYSIFHHKGEPNYIRAYDKLKSRVLLDWGFNIDKRMESSRIKVNSFYDVLHRDELDMVYKSSLRLADMYNEVIDRRTA